MLVAKPASCTRPDIDRPGVGKVFAISESLLPPDPRVEKFFSYANLENGLIAGGTIFLIGLGLSISAVMSWHAHHFGPLNVAQMLRLTLPAAAAMTLGVQIAVSSFFLGFYWAKDKRLGCHVT